MGRLSNYAGRRPVSIASLAFLVLGTLTPLNVHHVGILIAGRLLMGVGAGQITLGYGGLALLATLFTTVAARNTRTTAIGESRVGEAVRGSARNSR